MMLIATENLGRITLELKFQRINLLRPRQRILGLYLIGEGVWLKPSRRRITFIFLFSLEATNLEPLPSLEDLDNTVFGAERKKGLSVVGKKARV